MPVSIQMPSVQKQDSPLDKLATALSVAHSIYGVYASHEQLAQAQKKIDDEKNSPEKKLAEMQATQGLQTATALQDATSPESIHRRSLLNSYVTGLKNSEANKANKTAFDDIIKIANDPTTTGAQVEAIGKSPFLSDINAINKTNSAITINTNKANEKSATESGKDEGRVYKDTKAALEQMRGNPAVQQAEKDIYSADKVSSLFNQYGDLNKVPPAQVQLIASEIAKMAQGGAPTMAELHGLNPGTFSQGLATLAGKAANDPRGAEAGEFLKQFKGYADGIRGDAQNIIKDRYGRIIDASELSQSHRDKLTKIYGGRFDKPGGPPAGPEAPPVSQEDALKEARARGLIK